MDKENLESIVMEMTEFQLKLAMLCVIKGADVDYAILVSAGKQVKKSYLDEAIKKFNTSLIEPVDFYEEL